MRDNNVTSLKSVLILCLFCAGAVFAQGVGNTAAETGNTAAIPVVETGNDADGAVIEADIPPVEGEPASVTVQEAEPSHERKEGAKPKIAVYVTGGAGEADNKALTTYILSALIKVKSNQYEAIERSEAFLAQIDNEHVMQRSGAVDDAQISQLGKQSGVQFVCVADITPVRGSYQVSARILDVETAKVVTVGVANSPLRNAEDLRKVASAVVEAMFNLISPDSSKRAIRFRFGGRVAYNNSYLRKTSVSEMYPDDEVGIVTNTYDNRLGYGSGFGLGAVASAGVMDNLSVTVGVGVVYRNPVNLEIVTIRETALCVPALVQWRVLKSTPFYVEGGVQAEIPVKSTIIRETDEEPAAFDDRKPFDFGIAVGAGYFIDKNFSIDVRGIITVTPFDSYERHLLNQVNIGVSYLW